MNFSPRWIGSALLVATVALATGCSDNSTGTPEPPKNPEDVTFAPELGVDLSQMTRTASGLYYEVITSGEGVATVAGDTIAVDYKGWLNTGTLFGEGLFGFVLGDGAVIPGFDEGTTGMKPGEVRELVLPSSLGYGTSPPPGSGIPSQSVLVFDVELKGVGTEELIALGLL